MKLAGHFFVFNQNRLNKDLFDAESLGGHEYIIYNVWWSMVYTENKENHVRGYGGDDKPEVVKLAGQIHYLLTNFVEIGLN